VSDIVSRPSIGAALARRIVDGAVAHAEERGGTFTVAVVDESGVLKALHRMDGAALVSVQVAQDKAYTAIGFGIPTHVWHEFIKDDPPLAAGAPTGIDRLVIFGGGYPVVHEGVVVGGVGVSGGHYHDDMAVAEAGLRAAGYAPPG
jgi:uncharacterized protein GlcG (DUF336 family)